MARADSKKAAHRKTEEREEKPQSTILSPSSLWHTILPPLPPATNLAAPSAAQINSLIEKGASLMEHDTKSFLSASSSSSEATFFTKVIHSGTLSDRLSALTLLVQSSPAHNTKALDTLKNMSGKAGGGKNESLKALRCIVDWWVGGGAPDRKLKYFRDQPLLHPQISDGYLLLWYFEDWLKKYFFSVLQILETLSLDPVPYVRIQVISLIFNLLKDKPEQEQNLLRLLVNKLGDISKSICSRASYHLLQLLQSHPSMKSIVVREITFLILRPSVLLVSTTTTTPANKHIRFTSPGPSSKSFKSKLKPQDIKKARNPHAQYYATITLNQIVLTSSPTDREVALHLIDIYFELFQDILSSGGNYVGDTAGDEGDENLLEKGGQIQKDKKGRVVVKDKGKGGKGKETTGAAGFIEVQDSDSRLISAMLTGVNRALPFAKVEAGDTKINAHLGTLFLITHKSTFNISLQALVLIHQISSNLSQHSSSPLAKSIIDRYFRTLYASLHDHRLSASSKQAMYLNLLYKSIKNDPEVSSERRMAMVKRFVQVLVSGGTGATEFVVGGLYLLGELFSTVSGLRSMIFSNSESKAEAENYDPRKRDPLYAHATHSPLWELIPLLCHYHPTISLLTRQLLTAQPLAATPDLSQNTLSHFLDRFVYKNPKKKVSGAGGKGSSAMQPSGSAIEGIKLLKGEGGATSVEVNLPSFWKNKKETQIPVDQVFFYNYFKQKDESERRSKKRKEQVNEGVDDDDEDADKDEKSDEQSEVASVKGSDGTTEDNDNNEESEDDNLEEAEIWKAMKATMPDEDEDDVEHHHHHDDDDDDERDNSAGEDDIPSLVEASDNDDLLPLCEMTSDLIAYDSSFENEDEEEWEGIKTGSGEARKRKRADDKENDPKKKRCPLPTFASYEDYAKMIEDGPENDI